MTTNMLAVGEQPARDTKLAEFEREALPQLDFLYRFAVHLSGDAATAEDLVQETMLKAWRAWHTYAAGSRVRAWLATILRNTYIGQYRRRQREVDLPDADYSTLVSDLATQDAEGDFFDKLIDDEVRLAIAKLPAHFRETLVLSDVEELSYDQIAAITGVAIGTVKSRLFRARRLLQRELYAYAVENGYIKHVRTPVPRVGPPLVNGGSAPAATRLKQAAREPFTCLDAYSDVL